MAHPHDSKCSYCRADSQGLTQRPDVCLGHRAWLCDGCVAEHFPRPMLAAMDYIVAHLPADVGGYAASYEHPGFIALTRPGQAVFLCATPGWDGEPLSLQLDAPDGDAPEAPAAFADLEQVQWTGVGPADLALWTERVRKALALLDENLVNA